jgi:hypothetical protein
MKGDEQRGEFGTWLRRERKARFENVPAAVRSMQNEVGYGIAPSVWAELESGTRRPSEEQRQRLTRFFGSEPSKPDDDLAAAIRAQTEAMQAIAAAMTAVAEELRSDREASQGRTEGMAVALGLLRETLEQRLPLPTGTRLTRSA